MRALAIVDRMFVVARTMQVRLQWGLLWKQPIDRGAEKFIARVAEDRLCPHVYYLDGSRAVNDDNRVRNCIQQCFCPVLLCLDLRFSLDMRRKVVDREHRHERLSAAITYEAASVADHLHGAGLESASPHLHAAQVLTAQHSRQRPLVNVQNCTIER